MAPPPAPIGAELAGTPAPTLDPMALTAKGISVPEVQVQSLVPADVTADARIWLSAPATLPSGLVLPARLVEAYTPPGELTLVIPTIDLSVAFYRYPPVPSAPPGALSSSGPLRPRFLLEGHAAASANALRVAGIAVMAVGGMALMAAI